EGSALHMHMNPLMHTIILEGANHLKAGAIANVGQAWITMATKIALADESVLGAIKYRPPLFKLLDTISCLLREELNHPPLIQKFSAAHGIAKMDLPVVTVIDITQCRRHSAFGHDRVGFSE